MPGESVMQLDDGHGSGVLPRDRLDRDLLRIASGRSLGEYALPAQERLHRPAYAVRLVTPRPPTAEQTGLRPERSRRCEYALGPSLPVRHLPLVRPDLLRHPAHLARTPPAPR